MIERWVRRGIRSRPYGPCGKTPISCGVRGSLVFETMPLQNRVSPLGELIADPARGLVYGNRGCLHDETGRIRRSFAVKRWISCRLEFKGWKRTRLLQPGRFTELFFLDEATAFAAGHRPCALCRREDYDRFVALVPTRSTSAFTGSGSTPRADGGCTGLGSRIFQTGPSCSSGTSRGSCSATSCAAGRRPATPSAVRELGETRC